MLTDRVRSSPVRRVPVLLVLVLLAALAGGCGLMSDISTLSGRIEDAGYRDVGVNHKVTNGRHVVTVDAVNPDGPPADEDAERIARIVWESYPRTVDELQIVLNGQQAMPISRADLVQAFGERDPALDRGTGFARLLLIALLVILAVVALTVVLVVVLVRRSRRSKRLPDAPYPPYQQHQPGPHHPQVPPPYGPSSQGPSSQGPTPYPPPAPPFPPSGAPQQPGAPQHGEPPAGEPQPPTGDRH